MVGSMVPSCLAVAASHSGVRTTRSCPGRLTNAADPGAGAVGTGVPVVAARVRSVARAAVEASSEERPAVALGGASEATWSLSVAVSREHSVRSACCVEVESVAAPEALCCP